jgi:hypothetical protein
MHPRRGVLSRYTEPRAVTQLDGASELSIVAFTLQSPC